MPMPPSRIMEIAQSSNGQALPPPPEPLHIVPAADLLRDYPERRPAVIEGLLRQGETMNIIAAPKVGKSWLTLGLAFSVAHGLPWLDTFQCTKSRVLIIDNELHPETSAHRLRILGKALLLSVDGIDLMNLRGNLQDLVGLCDKLKRIERGQYGLVIIDAFYRTIPQNSDENSNAMMAGLYNVIDATAEKIGSAFSSIHHSSKGNQANKAITDVGSGAGAMSRATDTHLILRPHEEEGAVVLEAAVRSSAPVSPLCLRWSFPTWRSDRDLDVTALRAEKPRRLRRAEDQAAEKPVKEAWTAKRFAEAVGKPEPQPRGVFLEAGTVYGLSDRKTEQLLQNAVDCGYLFFRQEHGTYGKAMYSTQPPEPPTPEPAVEKKGKRQKS